MRLLIKWVTMMYDVVGKIIIKCLTVLLHLAWYQKPFLFDYLIVNLVNYIMEFRNNKKES